jgi:hypothetical protein
MIAISSCVKRPLPSTLGSIMLKINVYAIKPTIITAAYCIGKGT